MLTRKTKLKTYRKKVLHFLLNDHGSTYEDLIEKPNNRQSKYEFKERENTALGKKCQNTGFFLVHIFLYSV